MVATGAEAAGAPQWATPTPLASQRAEDAHAVSPGQQKQLRRLFEEIHVDRDLSHAFTCGATALLDIETKPPSRPSARLTFWE